MLNFQYVTKMTGVAFYVKVITLSQIEITR